MDEQELRRAMGKDSVRRALLEELEGGYSLGVARDPEGGADLVLLLRVEGERARERRELVVEGRKVPVVIEGGDRPVVPLKGRKPAWP